VKDQNLIYQIQYSFSLYKTTNTTLSIRILLHMKNIYNYCIEPQKKVSKRVPKVPTLDFKKVYEIQYEQNMEYEEEEEEEEEENSNGSILIIIYIGGQFSESEKRQIDLQRRKDKIVALLNNCHDKNEQETESEQPEEESEESARTKLRRKLGGSKDINFYPKKKSKQQE
jgi:hypothetical protein